MRQWSLTVKLGAIVVVFVLIIAALLALTALSLRVYNGARAYVGGEGLWSKGQKDAVYHLTRYALSGDAADYARYAAALEVPLGDRGARLEMEKPRYDETVVRRGFVAGGNAAEDVPDMVFLFRHFRHVGHLERAIAIWREGDSWIDELDRCGEELHAAITQGTLSPQRQQALLARIDHINDAVTPLERDFSATLGEGARWLRAMLLRGVLGLTLLLLLLGIGLAGLIAREIRAGLARLREGALRVSAGDLEHPVPLRGDDEFSDLAGVFNAMVEHRRDAEEALRKIAAELAQRAEQLARSNEELERFAYVASHDLQEPLRGVTGFAQLLERRFGQEPQVRDYVEHLSGETRRMRQLIDGLLAYARVSQGEQARTHESLEHLLERALAQLRGAIADCGAEITHDPLPTLPVHAPLIVQLLQNLVGNAIKFRGSEAPRIHVSAGRENGSWRISVQDNGIGIEPQYAERVFRLFQRLHTREEYPGSGLGLAICRKIVERHGGHIWVEPATPHGSVFHFTLPAEPAAAA